jgi:hypothetical protein
MGFLGTTFTSLASQIGDIHAQYHIGVSCLQIYDYTFIESKANMAGTGSYLR